MLRQARFWDRVALRYAGESITDLTGYERSLRRVGELLGSGHEVLEIGCGTGATALRLAPGVRRLHATDVSGRMIAIARQRWHAQPMAQLSFEQADASTAAAAPAAYDRVLAFNLLHLLTDLDRGLAAVAATLRPGGLFISKTACVAEMNPLVPHLIVPLMRALGRAPALLCLNESRLVRALAGSGLDVIAIERHGSTRRDIRAFIVARKPG